MKKLLLILLLLTFSQITTKVENKKYEYEYKDDKNKVEIETKSEFEYLKFTVTATVYNACEAQCNSDPLTTADGSYIEVSDIENLNWIAVSRDLLKNGIQYGDVVELVHEDKTICGLYEVHDCMNKRWTNRIDILMPDNIKTGKWENVTLRKLKKRD